MSARSWFIVDALIVVANLLCLAFLDGGVWNGIVAVALTVPAVAEFQQWRDEVSRERRWTA